MDGLIDGLDDKILGNASQKFQNENFVLYTSGI